MSQDITTLGMAVDSTEVRSATSDLDKMAAAGDKAAVAATKVGETSDFAEKRAAILARHAKNSADALENKAASADKAAVSTAGFSMSTAAAVAVGTLLGEVLLKVGGAMIDWVGKALQAASASHEMSARLGVVSEDLAGLQAAFRTSGVEAGGMQQAMQQLQRAAFNNSEALQRLGIESKNANGEFKTSKELLYEVAERFEGTRNSAEKTAVAVQLFGRSAAQLLPLLNEGVTGLRDMAIVAEHLGLVITTETAVAGNKLSASLDLIGAGLSAVITNGITPILPALADMADQFMRSDTLAGLLSVTAGALGLVVKTLTSIFDGLITTISTVGVGLGGLWSALDAFVKGDLGAAKASLVLMAEDIGASWERSGKRINDTWGDASKRVGEATGKTLQLADATKKADAENEKYIDGMREQNAVMAATIENGGKLTRSQTAEVKLLYELTNGTRVMTNAQLESALGAINQAAALETANAAIVRAERSSKAATQASAAYARQQKALRDGLDDVIDKQLLAIETQEELTEQVFRATSYEDQYERALKSLSSEFVKANKLQGDAAVQYRIALQALASLTAEQRVKIALLKEDVAWQKTATDENRRSVEETLKMADAVVSETAKMREKNNTLGMTTRQLGEYHVAELVARADSLERQANLLKEAGLEGEKERALRAGAEALRDQAKEASRGTLLQVAKDTADEWSKTVKDIERGLTDSLYRAFESGKNFFSTLWEGIKNTFKTTVLKIAVQAIMNPVNQILGSVLGGLGGSANAAGSVLGGGGDFLGSMIGSAGSSWLGTALGIGSGAGILGGSAAYGAAIGSASIGVGSQAAMLAAQTGSFGAAGLTATAGSAGGLMGSIGSAIAAIPVWGWIAAGLAAIALSLDKSGTPHIGGSATADNMGSSIVANNGWFNQQRSKEVEDMMLGAAKGVAGLLNALSAANGGANYSVTTAYADDSSKDPGQGQFRVTRDGAEVIDWGQNYSRLFAEGEAGVKQYMAAIAVSTKDAIDSMGLPEWASKIFDSLGGAPTLEQLTAAAQQVAGTQAALSGLSEAMTPLGGVFSRVALLGADATLQLAGFAGGMDALIAKTRSYVEAYYSDAERTGLQAAALLNALNEAGVSSSITSRDEFRAIVDSTDVTTEVGRQQLAALLDIAPVFASMSAILAETGKSLEELAAQAPQVAILEQNVAQTGAVVGVSESVMTIGEQITSAIVSAQASSEAGQAAAIAATQALTRLMERFDSNDALAVRVLA